MNNSTCSTSEEVIGSVVLEVLLSVYIFLLSLFGTVGNIIVAIATFNPVNFDIDKVKFSK